MVSYFMNFYIRNTLFYEFLNKKYIYECRIEHINVLKDGSLV